MGFLRFAASIAMIFAAFGVVRSVRVEAAQSQTLYAATTG